MCFQTDIGTYRWIAPGSSAIITVGDPEKWARQPQYTLFTANDNAICVALITTTWAGLGGHYAWLGDWGSECAGNNETMGTWYCESSKTPGRLYQSYCIVLPA